MEDLEETQSQERASRITAIERIDTLLKENLDEIYRMMIENKNVKLSGLKPTKEQFKQYWQLLKKGLEYVSSKYGEYALPENLTFYTGEMRTGGLRDTDFIGYMPEEDNLGISFLHIAGQCARYNQPDVVFIDSHLPEGYGVVSEDYTVLQAIEEGYHRHQIQKLGFKPEATMRDINHPNFPDCY